MLQRKLYRFQCEQRPIWVFLRDQQRWIEQALVVELEGDLVTLRYDADDDDELHSWEECVRLDSIGAVSTRLAFFSRTDAQVRLRILEGRRTRLEQRLRELEASIERTNERMDVYAERLQRHGIEGAEREVHWLEDLISTERGARQVRREAKQVKKAAKAAARNRREHA